MRHWLMAILIVLGMSEISHAQPKTFEEAKQTSRRMIYHDQNSKGDLYCHCNWEWVGKSGGRILPQSCGYTTRAQQNRADRVEWEHIVPASTFGRQRQCWQNGGRENCNRSDPIFNQIEADLHNLAPVVGEVNGDRSNFNMGMTSGIPAQYGQCPFKVDFKNRTAEPPVWAKGLIARVHFYMADRYQLRLSAQQERILLAWDTQYPVSEWEKERDRRIAKQMGFSNPFVTGQKKWTVGYRPSGQTPPMPPQQPQRSTSNPSVPLIQPSSGSPYIWGNKNSQIYHIQHQCPGYDTIATKNRVPFATEQQAQSSGYRKAQNCK